MNSTLIAILAAHLLCQAADFSKIINVSKETTVLTEPLAPDGLPDYEAYLLRQGFKGLTSENNAAVLFWNVLWPCGVEEKYQEPLRKSLNFGLEINATPKLVQTNDPSLNRQLLEWLVDRERSDATSMELDEASLGQMASSYFVQDIIVQTQTRIWTRDDLPPMASWIEANEKPFTTMLEATIRPKFYSPPPNFLSGEKAGLIPALLPSVQNLEQVVKAFASRAMFNLGEGRSEQSWQDALASFRVAQLASQGAFAVEQLVARAVEAYACDMTIAILHHGNLTEAETREVLLTLQQLPPLKSMADTFDRYERLSYADAVLAMATGRNNAVGTLGEDISDVADWDIALREGNEYFDRIVDAAKIPQRDIRAEVIATIDKELEERAASNKSVSTRISAALSKEERSKAMSNVMLCNLFPSIKVSLVADERGVTKRRLTIVAAALALHRFEEGSYPDNLEQLVPEIIKELPIDLYSGRQFIYQRKVDGYLLYCVNEDVEDNQGTDFGGKIIKGEWVSEEQDVDYQESDIVIRMPLPEFKIPELETAN